MDVFARVFGAGPVVVFRITVGRSVHGHFVGRTVVSVTEIIEPLHLDFKDHLIELLLHSVHGPQPVGVFLFGCG